MHRRIVFDFDGVIHSYTSGWKGYANIPDPPVEGIKDLIDMLKSAGYEIVVQSARCDTLDGDAAVREYLDKHNIKVDRTTSTKIPATVYVDDRGYRFNGPISEENIQTVFDEITSFRPWNR